jgi:hypothetical protein
MRASNPYQGVGQIADGLRFVDRSAELNALRTGWTGERPGNVSLQGNFRMGKSSLVRMAAKAYARDNPQNVAVVIGAGSLRDGKSLLRIMAKRVHQAIERTGVADSRVAAAFGPLAASMELEEWTDVVEAVVDFFRVISFADIAVLMIVDEFDRLSSWAGLAEFQVLRDLASEPEFSVGLTTVSRRSVYEIETAGFGGSTLGGVLGHSVRVGLFSLTECAAMVRKGGDGEESPVSWGDLEYLAGTHPFLLELACFYQFDSAAPGAIQSRDFVAHRIRDQAESLYDVYLRELEAEIPGSVVELRRTINAGDDVSGLSFASRLGALGLARELDGRLVPFSGHFGDYVKG